MDTKRYTITVVALASLWLTTALLFFLSHTRYERRIQHALDEVERFERMAALNSYKAVIAVERLNKNQQYMRKTLQRAVEIVLTAEGTRLYNAETEPEFLINVKGGKNAQTQKLLHTQRVHPGAPYGTGPWDETVPVPKNQP